MELNLHSPLTLLYNGARFSETPVNLYQIRGDNINEDKIPYMLGVNLGGTKRGNKKKWGESWGQGRNWGESWGQGRNWGESWRQGRMCIEDWFRAIYPFLT